MAQVLSNQDRYKYWGDHCPPWSDRMIFTIWNGTVMTIHKKTEEAWKALNDVLIAFWYSPRQADTGAYNCRHMRHDPTLPMSNHAWAIAADINWQTNPAKKYSLRGDSWFEWYDTDMPEAMVKAIKAIRTKSGEKVFRWGGDWNQPLVTALRYRDTMHWEVIASPADLETGIDWSTVLPGAWDSEIERVLLEFDEEIQMAKTETRVKVAKLWIEKTGLWPYDGADGEPASDRLYRIAGSLDDGSLEWEKLEASVSKFPDLGDKVRSQNAHSIPDWVFVEIAGVKSDGNAPSGSGSSLTISEIADKLDVKVK